MLLSRACTLPTVPTCSVGVQGVLQGKQDITEKAALRLISAKACLASRSGNAEMFTCITEALHIAQQVVFTFLSHVLIQTALNLAPSETARVHFPVGVNDLLSKSTDESFGESRAKASSFRERGVLLHLC